MSTDNGVLDLDAIAIELEVRLGGKMFVVREATIEQNKEILRAVGVADAAADDDGDDGLRNLDAIYPQLKLIMRDKTTGKPPTKEHVEKHLTTSGLKALMARISPDDEAEAGNSVSSPATST